MTNEEESTQEPSGRGDAAPPLRMASSALRRTTTREDVVTWLLSPPDSRTSDQVAAIVALLSHFPKLRTAGETALTALGRQITACQPCHGEVLIKSGESPDCLYMILDGIVVLLESNQHSYAGNHNGRGYAGRRRSSNGANRGGGRQSESRDGKPDDVLARCVTWELLGDEAILAGMRLPCRAQVESAQALLLVVPKHLFHETISQSVRAAFNRKIDFLARLPVFSNMPRRVVEKLAPFFYEMELRPKELLCRQGDAADCMWAVVSGRCHVVIDPHWSPAANRPPETNSKRTSQVAAVQSGGLIGEMCVFGAVRHRATTVRAATDAVVYRLKRLHFLRICPPAQLEELRAIAEAKMLLLAQAEREEAGVASRLNRVLRGHSLRDLYPSHRAHLLRDAIHASLPLPPLSIRPLSPATAAASYPGSAQNNTARRIAEANMSIRGPEQEVSYEVEFDAESSYNSRDTKSEVLDLDSDTTHSSWVQLAANAGGWARSPAVQATAPPVGRPPPALPVPASAAARLDAVLSQLVDPGEDWKPDGSRDRREGSGEGEPPPYSRQLYSNFSGRGRIGGGECGGNALGGSDGGIVSGDRGQAGSRGGGGGPGQLRRKSLPAVMPTRVPPAPTTIAALPFGWGYTFLRSFWEAGGAMSASNVGGGPDTGAGAAPAAAAYLTEPGGKQPHARGDAGERKIKALTSSGGTGTGGEQAPSAAFPGCQDEALQAVDGVEVAVQPNGLEKGKRGKRDGSQRDSESSGGDSGRDRISPVASEEGSEGLSDEGLEGAGGQERLGDGSESDAEESVTEQLLPIVPRQLLPLVDLSWNFGPCSILKVLYTQRNSSGSDLQKPAIVVGNGGGRNGGDGECSISGGAISHRGTANAVDPGLVSWGAAAKGTTSGQVRCIPRNTHGGFDSAGVPGAAASTNAGGSQQGNSASGEECEDSANATPEGAGNAAVLPLQRRCTTPDTPGPWSFRERERNSGGSTVVGFGRGMSFGGRQSVVVPGPPALSIGGGGSGKGPPSGEAPGIDRHSLPQLRPQQGLAQPHLSAHMPHRGTRGWHSSMTAAAAAAAAAVAAVGPGTPSASLLRVTKMSSEPLRLDSDSAAGGPATSPTNRCESPPQGSSRALLPSIISRCSSRSSSREHSPRGTASSQQRDGGSSLWLPEGEKGDASVSASTSTTTMARDNGPQTSSSTAMKTVSGSGDGAANTAASESASEAVAKASMAGSDSPPKARTNPKAVSDNLGSSKAQAAEAKTEKAVGAKAPVMPRFSEDSIASHTSDNEEAPVSKEAAASATTEGGGHTGPAAPGHTGSGSTSTSNAVQRPKNESEEKSGQDGGVTTTNAAAATAAVSTGASGSGSASTTTQSTSEVEESAGPKGKGPKSKKRLRQPPPALDVTQCVDNNTHETPPVHDSPQVTMQAPQQRQQQEQNTHQLQFRISQASRQTQQQEQQTLQEQIKKGLLTFDWHAAQTNTPWSVVPLSQAPSVPSSLDGTAVSPGRGSSGNVRASSGGALLPLPSYPYSHLQSKSRSGPSSPVAAGTTAGPGGLAHLPSLRGRPGSPVGRRLGASITAYTPVAQSLAANRAVLAAAASLASGAICPSSPHGIPPGFNPSSSTGNALAALLAPGGGRTSLPANVRQPNMIVKGGLVYRAASRQRSGEMVAGGGGSAGGRGSISGACVSLAGSASSMMGGLANLQG